MSPLQRQLARLRARVRWLLLLQGVGRALAVGLVGLLALGFLDQVFRYDDPGLRLISSLTAVGWLAWAAYRHLYRLCLVRVDDVELALRVERHFDALRDRLASAVEFLHAEKNADAWSGSAALRQAAIRQATAAVEGLDFRQVLDRRPTAQALFAAAAVGLVAVTVAAVQPQAARIALARLVHPFGDTGWPQVTHLELRRRVESVARGQPFEVEVIDAQGARLPAEVRIWYRFEGPEGSLSLESEIMRPLGDAVFARRENLTRPFAYRIEGGDDRGMPWIDVQIVEPPRMVELRVRLLPPEYSGWPEMQSSGPIRALVGTRLEFTATTNKPLGTATLCFDDGRRLAAEQIAPTRLQAPGPGSELLVEKSGAYWFELTDQQAMPGPPSDRWEIHAVTDQPPRVALEQPAVELFVTPSAQISLRAAVQDDLALAQVELEYQRSDRPDPPAAMPLYTGPPRARPGEKTASAELPGGEVRSVAQRWDLAPLALEPGTTVSLLVTARDYRGSTGRSERRSVHVISPEELQVRLTSRQEVILNELARSLALQRQSREQLAALGAGLAKHGRREQVELESIPEPAPSRRAVQRDRPADGFGDRLLESIPEPAQSRRAVQRDRPADGFGDRLLDHLQSVVLSQRQVDHILGGPTESLWMLVQALLADIASNRLDTPDLRRRMEGLLAAIEHLQQDPLAKIALELTAAVKSAQIALQDESRGAWQEPAQRLQEAVRQQESVIAALQTLVSQWRQWDDYRRFHRQIAELLGHQQQLASRTAELAQSTLTRDVKDLRPQDVAELKLLGTQQLDLALRLDQSQQQMGQMAEPLAAVDPLAADTLAEAAQLIQRLGLSAQIRAVRSHLEQNRMGQAMDGQKLVVQSLREVLEVLAGAEQRELARIATILAQTQRELDSLLLAQNDLADRMRHAARQEARGEWDALVEPQKDLGKQAATAARRLEQLRVAPAAGHAKQAAESMNRGAQAASQGDSTASLRRSDEAQAALRQAQAALQQRQAELQSQLAAEATARLRGDAARLQEQQEHLLTDTVELETVRTARGRLSAKQQSNLAELARRQRELQTATGYLAQQAGGGAFELALTRAAAHMAGAADLLEQRRTGTATRQLQTDAARHLALLLAALEDQGPSAPASAGKEGQESQLPAEADPATLAQWRLIRLLQQDLLHRTRQLGEPGPGDEARRLQAARLSEEQGELARLLLQSLRRQTGAKP